MKLKEFYSYFYYKLYKLFQVDERDWLSEWKASLLLNVLIFCFLFSILIYYNIYINQKFNLEISNFKFGLLYMLILAFPNYIIFHYNSRWLNIVRKYDLLSKKTNRLGDWIVYSIVILIILNLIFAFYLMSLVNWGNVNINR